MKRTAGLTALFAFGLVKTCLAIGPHECAVIYNTTVPVSRRIAETYASARHIPAQNLVGVRVPLRHKGNSFELSPEAFTAQIWAPVMGELRSRGLREQIQAWLYSTHFPLRISTRPAISLTGLTFLRNRVPKPADVQDGTYDSPLFGGEGMIGHPGFAPQTFEVFHEWLRDEMPLPCMLLGVAGKGANTEQQILACLRRGVESDATHPDGDVYFITSADVRSRCREWQFPSGAKALRNTSLRARIVTEAPRKASRIMGVMMGAPSVQPETMGTFLPGAMAEHLTSFGGDFANAHQTKLTAWIAAGATASAGTVTEPYSIPAKFPMARFYGFYAAGCTIIESFYQSVQCPLQLVMVGDPLASPWSPVGTVSINGVPAGPATQTFTVNAHTRLAEVQDAHFSRFCFLLDGKLVGKGSVTVDPQRLSPGTHTIRAIALRTGLVRSQLFAEQSFTVAP